MTRLCCYLLEALNKHQKSLSGMYAFQAGSQSDAEAKWRHKGVLPIAYDETDGHKSLWDTLSAWACRAQNPDSWYGNVIDSAEKGHNKHCGLTKEARLLILYPPLKGQKG